MIAGINGSEALILLVIVLIVVGPERLPRYAAQLGKFIRSIRVMLTDAQTRVRDELAQEGEEIPWDKLDPRQYDPRRIVRDAVMGDEDPAPNRAVGAGAAAAAASTIKVVRRDPNTPPPFDSEAT